MYKCIRCFFFFFFFLVVAQVITLLKVCIVIYIVFLIKLFRPSFHGQLFFGEGYLSQKLTFITELAHVCHIYLTMKLRHRIEFTQAYFSTTNLLCQRKIVCGNEVFIWILLQKVKVYTYLPLCTPLVLLLLCLTCHTVTKIEELISKHISQDVCETKRAKCTHKLLILQSRIA